jgi:hypothetical protein
VARPPAAVQSVENPLARAGFSTNCSVDEQNVENRQPGFGFSTFCMG